MKNLVSIGLLTIFLFTNLGGYHLVYRYLNYRADKTLDQRLDAGNYEPGERITIKVPLTLPYFVDQNDYERIEGSYEQDGEFFKLIEQKFEQDTLYIVSIKHHKKKLLFNTLADFVKLSGDLPAPFHRAMKLLNSIEKNFTPYVLAETSAIQGWSQECSRVLQFYPLLVQDSSVASPPPKQFFL